MKKTVLAILFICICLVTALTLTDILKQKWPQEESNAAQQIVVGYYQEKPNTIDVLGIGASTIRNGISPLSMFNEYGFTTYLRATSVQLPMISYHLLRETLDTHDIKVVIMDASSLLSIMLNGYSQEDLAGKIHEAVDYMPWSSYKTDIIHEAVAMEYPVTMADFLFPLSAYHDRWAEINKNDFTYRSWQDDYCYKGQNPIIRTTNDTFDSLYMSEEEKDSSNIWIDTKAAEYYKKIIGLCKEKGIAFILVKTPSSRATSKSSQLLQSFADENGIVCFDFNRPEIQEEIGFNSHTDYADSGDHPNITGADKISRWLGKYIKSVCELEDKRDKAEYSSWKDSVQQYEYLLEDAALARETNMISYLQKSCKPGYLVMMATRSDTALHFTDELAETFETLGINAAFREFDYLSYAAVINDGSIVIQQLNDDPYDDNNPVQCEAVADDHIISILSQASKVNSKASIVIDGKSTGDTSSGFNFAVYDKRINQVVSVKAFRTGLKGTEYRYPNPFSEYISDPISYLDLLNNDDYITVIGVATEGSQYMPGIVNDKMAEMGLIPLDKEINRPYIAVMDGNKIIYNEYGEPGTELMDELKIEEIPVLVISNTNPSDAHLYFCIGEETAQNNKNTGLIFYVYSKSEQRQVTYNRFDWRGNQLSTQKVNGITNVPELLKASQRNGYDVYLLNIGKENAISDAYLQLINEYGFSELTTDSLYAGYVAATCQDYQFAENGKAEITYEREGRNVILTAGEKTGEAVFDGVVYPLEKEGLYLFVYDPACRAVLTQIRHQEAEQQKEENPFDAYYGKPNSNPFPYFDLLNNDDLITVIGVATEGSRYMPDIVNDKLAEMGLIPLDKELDRPYLAVLDGTKVIYNEYGEPGSEIMADLETDGIKVSLISNTKPSEANLYISVGEEKPQKNKNPGLIFYVYSKSQQKQVGYNRFEWSGNQLSVQKMNGITNILELLTTAKKNDYEVFCLNVGKENKISDAYLRMMKEYGFKGLESWNLYAGYVLTEGQGEQKAESGEAEVRVEREGLTVQLTAGEERGKAVINGATYTADKEGLYLFVYDPACRAVLTQVRYDQ